MTPTHPHHQAPTPNPHNYAKFCEDTSFQFAAHLSLRRISFFLRTISLYSLSRYSETENLVLSSSAIRMGGFGYIGSSASLWNCATYGCRKASSAVMRLLGLNFKQRRRRSRASGEAWGNISERKRGLEGGNDSNILAAKGDLIDSMSSADGLPVTSIILSSWFMVEVPGKMGFPPSISPRMQPMDQMSTPFVYLVEPNRISGARYQRVAT
mmetsp:Transcript_9671/g.15147  ORF Transcript_9671/g.15147 Transcript_9671/m.15147 type:complete len:211 (+) Transcript_9671:262-894(+)|eukprot:CAMPEP_0184288416 /NCGR_PEP_ID=MMETSP1049-20130417/945_1 /TAXON_ID=77928 /ORGANISM="Proteomonas sulcata, Strain CCMP704" /LENGTH=210 /DNA_ID=CAMNT_0026594805 /DNA_START=226 /DNA_END=858 /DNA_ORIENTATION=+